MSDSGADYEALETVASAAIEIIRELREELGLSKGVRLTDAVRQLYEDYLVCKGMEVAREVIAANAPKK